METEVDEEPVVALENGVRDWNEEFQQLKERELLMQQDHAAEFDRLSELRTLIEDFAKTAETIGTKIISELFLPMDRKTIVPRTSSVGGVAGGAKYIEQGIFFKFPVDEKNLYGGDEFSMKTAGHEFLSLMQLMDCRVRGLHFPMVVLIDYLGYRLVAESILPLGPHSLVAGTSDGANTIHNDNVGMAVRLELISKILNLQPHYVWNWEKTKRTLIYNAIDCEGHLGADGRYYVIDAARLFPAATPTPRLKGCHLYRLLRPELVRNYSVPLCSDTFSSFNLENSHEYELNSRDATSYLEDHVISKFGSALDLHYSQKNFQNLNLKEEAVKLVLSIHRKGINVRYLGKIRGCCSYEPVKCLVLTEIIARVVKNQMRAGMRALKISEMRKYAELSLSYLNLVFGISEKSEIYWKSFLKECLEKRFSETLSTCELKNDFDLRRSVFVVPLFQRILDLVRISLKFDVKEGFNLKGDVMVLKVPLSGANYREFLPSTKYMHRLHFEEGTALSKQASREAKECVEFSSKLYEEAEKRYKASIQTKADDFKALYNWGLSIQARAMSCQDSEKCLGLLGLATLKFQEALEINERDGHALYLLGNLLVAHASRHDCLQLECGSQDISFKLKETLTAACEIYEKSHDIEPYNLKLLFNWGSALLSMATIFKNLRNF
eukprot:TRINITY_DN9620_c0_g1_i3.p1 TRINITY_DN9620_c0_g1~~TRINITY_DN9620_c0_g1_i3.p1  ORF type:complete len:666 (+),score=209.19 TRINITY_DN9620_c0_g1_i3:3-2000(+)